jgi:hypothetical protein
MVVWKPSDKVLKLSQLVAARPERMIIVRPFDFYACSKSVAGEITNSVLSWNNTGFKYSLSKANEECFNGVERVFACGCTKAVFFSSSHTVSVLWVY